MSFSVLGNYGEENGTRAKTVKAKKLPQGSKLGDLIVEQLSTD